GGLTPVSTSDGIDWFLTGNKVDSFLTNANVPKYITDKDGNKNPNPAIREGNYIFLDFWVVAPAGDYTLRISTGEEDKAGGSFVIDLPVPVENEEGKLVLQKAEGSAAAAVRIGFLANPVTITDDTMTVYRNSNFKDDRFTALRGLYFEPNTGSYHSDLDNFVIYEPNADYHPGNSELDGTYVQTKPFVLSAEGNAVENPDIWDHLTVQLRSEWYTQEEADYTIYSAFETNAMGNAFVGKTTEQIMAEFYVKQFGGQFSQLIKKGSFMKYSVDDPNSEIIPSSLKQALDNSGKISAAQLAGLQQSGATEDVEIIKLERNIPQRIRMFIWLEGQDIDCAASAKSASFAVNIEFAGGSK
ncbi:MAG: hypothetical protein IKJ57_04720, partial [Oscillospiraceae bacterium]|nr:hypothetical protein [Oscillospiraceae bacterium]